MPFLLCFKPLKKVSCNNSFGYQDSSFNSAEQSSYQSFKENLEYQEDSGYKFNFNPKEEPVSVFIDKILMTALDGTKIDKLKARQRNIDFFQKKCNHTFDKEKKSHWQTQINKLSYNLKQEGIQVNEKIKITFKGFDICEQAMPLELLYFSKNILVNTILFLIRQGYINAQIISLFDLDLEQYEKLSRKEKKDTQEKNKFENILTFVSKAKALIRLVQCNAENKYKEKIAILQELKAMGVEGEKAYFLLLPLLNYNPEVSNFSRPYFIK